MTVVFADGFDGYTGNTGSAVAFASKWTTTGGSYSLQTGRYGGQALRMGTASPIATGVFTAAVTSFTVSMSLKNITLDSDRAIGFSSGATAQVGFSFNTDGSLTAYRNATSLGSSATGLINTSGTWRTLVIEVVISDTVGRVTAYLDGSQILNLTSQDTRNGTPTDVDRIVFNPANTNAGSFDIDDLFVTDSATQPTDNHYIETVAVNADGGTLNWTPSTGSDHFAVVDELPASTTDYLSASTVGNIDELEVGAMASTPTGILAAQFVGHFDKTDGTVRAVKLGVKSGATTSAGTDAFLVASPGGSRVERLLNNDPNTATTWTKSGLEAAKIRPEVSV